MTAKATLLVLALVVMATSGVSSASVAGGPVVNSDTVSRSDPERLSTRGCVANCQANQTGIDCIKYCGIGIGRRDITQQ
uniref:Conotoxin Cl14.9 n=1 Tax=Californiconus californicus TaxID=1736779 RepID=CUE9_CONCL